VASASIPSPVAVLAFTDRPQAVARKIGNGSDDRRRSKGVSVPDENQTVVIVRGAGPAGRGVAARVTEVGAVPVVLDERTCAHENVRSVRVPFDDPASPRRAMHDIVSRHGGLDALVLLPAPTAGAGASSGASWEATLGHELMLVAGMVRSAAPALAASSAGVVIPVVVEPRDDDPSLPAALLGPMTEPVLGALADGFGFRVTPVRTAATGTARGSAAAEAVVEQLVTPGTGSGHRETVVSGGVG
jgi:hypothetical protein